MKSLVYKSSLFLLVFSAVSCFSTDDRNYQYFPDMYESEAYEAYGEYEIFVNSQEAKLPVENSVPRGWMPYDYPNTQEGYDAAKATLENPLPYTEENVTHGKELYNIYCAVCHGDKGDGKGILATREKIMGIPAYNAPGRNITPGSAYHVMFFGRNTMGSYANQTTEMERWKIAMYVMDLKSALDGAPKREYEEGNPEAQGMRDVNLGLNMNAVPTVKNGSSSENISMEEETTIVEEAPVVEETKTLNEE